jgi:hypothetical protein
LKTPDWITDYIAYWKPLLFLQEWTIKTEIVDKLEHDDDFACIVETDHVYLRAKIKIINTVPQALTNGVISHYDRETWEKNILHELVHIRLARINEFMRECIFNGFSSREASLLNERLRVEDENATVLVTETLFQMNADLERAQTVILPENKWGESPLKPEFVVKKEYEGEPDPNLVHPGGLSISDFVEQREDGLFHVKPKMEKEYREWERNRLSKTTYTGFDNGNMIVPPPDMSADIKAWEDNLKASSNG